MLFWCIGLLNSVNGFIELIMVPTHRKISLAVRYLVLLREVYIVACRAVAG
jgi:hypothetical protein